MWEQIVCALSDILDSLGLPYFAYKLLIKVIQPVKFYSIVCTCITIGWLEAYYKIGIRHMNNTCTFEV